jgi:RNA-directed DNA polymerase
VNDAKTAVAQAFGRKFLSSSVWRHFGEVKCRVSVKALATFKRRVRSLTRRVIGRSLEQVAERLQLYVPGWKSYFQLAQTRTVFQTLEAWIRHRLSALQLKHWKKAKTIYRELVTRGVVSKGAFFIASSIRSWWNNSQHPALNRIKPIEYFDRLGVPRLL